VVIVNVAVRLLMLVGLNVTLIVQLLLPASEEPQLLVCEKSGGSVPPIAMLEIVIAVVVPFVTVTVCGALEELSTCSPYERDVGVTVTGAVPVPVTAM